MANIARLNVMLVANAKRFNAGLKSAGGHLRNFSRRASAFASNIASHLRVALQRIAIVATGVGIAFAYMVKQTSASIDTQTKMARRLGLTYKQFKAIEYATSLAGLSTATVNVAFEKIADTLGAAQFGDLAAVRAFEQIGLTVEDLERLRPEQRFQAIANAINNIPDPSKRLAAARDIAGRGGGSLIEFFRGGGNAILEATQKIELFGLALSDLDTAGLEYMNDRLSDVGRILEGVRTQLSIEVSPIISQVADDTIAWVEALGGVPRIMSDIIPIIAKGFDWILKLSDRILSTWDLITSLWDKIPDWAKRGPTGLISDLILDAPELPGGGLRQRVERRTKERAAMRGGTFEERARGYLSRAKDNFEKRKLDQINAPRVEEEKQRREFQMRREFEMRQYNAAMEREKQMAKIRAQAERHPEWFGGLPGAARNRQEAISNSMQRNPEWFVRGGGGTFAGQSGMGGDQTVGLLQQIAINTGKNNIAWAN